MEASRLQIPPFSIEVDGHVFDVIEVLKTQLLNGETWYHVVVRLNYKGIKSRTYTLDVRSEQDLINKLKAEVTKVKFMEYAYGIDELRRLIT